MYKIVFFTTERTKAVSTEVIEVIWVGFSTYAEALMCIADYDYNIPINWEWDIIKE